MSWLVCIEDKPHPGDLVHTRDFYTANHKNTLFCSSENRLVALPVFISIYSSLLVMFASFNADVQVFGEAFHSFSLSNTKRHLHILSSFPVSWQIRFWPFSSAEKSVCSPSLPDAVSIWAPSHVETKNCFCENIIRGWIRGFTRTHPHTQSGYACQGRKCDFQPLEHSDCDVVSAYILFRSGVAVPTTGSKTTIWAADKVCWMVTFESVPL